MTANVIVDRNTYAGSAIPGCFLKKLLKELGVNLDKDKLHAQISFCHKDVTEVSVNLIVSYGNQKMEIKLLRPTDITEDLKEALEDTAMWVNNAK